MIVMRLEDVIGSERHVVGEGWESRRLILKSDRMGYSVHDTVLKEGTEQVLEYKHHLEANYCISGEGEVIDVATGALHVIRPGTLYALDRHDRHILRATKGDLRLVCVFNPALTGRETHDEEGGYTLPDEA